jgi:hypothetical protein
MAFMVVVWAGVSLHGCPATFHFFQVFQARDIFFR